MFKKIIVPIDFSENSLKLVRPAKFFAKKFNAEVHIVHVAEEEKTFNIHSGDDLIKFFEEISLKREGWLNEIAQEFEKDGIRVQIAVVKQHSASVAILDYIEEQKIDFGLISTVGIERLKTILIGSTTKQIIKHSKIPFLSINQFYREPEEFKLNKILVTTDFSEISYQGINFAANLSKAFDSKLMILHVIKLPSYIPILPGEPPLEIPPHVVDFVREQFTTELDKIKNKLGAENLDYDIITGSDKADVISEYAGNNSFDLIVIPKIGEGFIKSLLLGRVAENMVKVSTLPVITFHPEQ